MQLAESAAHDKGLLESGKRISNGWYCRFMERQPQLTLRRASIRMECTSKEVMEECFKLLKSMLTENNLLDEPSRFYNVDETGMPLDHHSPKLVAYKGQKKVRTRTSGNKPQVTAIACVSATGQVIPPFVIFVAKQLSFQQKFQCEGFDIPDPLYLQWLKINHPSEQKVNDSLTQGRRKLLDSGGQDL